MARTVKDPSERKAEILASARKLLYTKGFEQMTVQDILDDLGISKGAFYHYFNSKQDLLAGFIEAMLVEARTILSPIIADPALNAVEKMNRYFSTGTSWKLTQRDFLLPIMRVWFSDENILVRNKVQVALMESLGPMIAAIIRQGIAEGSMSTDYPDQSAQILLGMMANMGEYGTAKVTWADLSMDDFPLIESTSAAYNIAMERIVGLPPGSVKVLNTEALKDWIQMPAGAGE